MNPFKHPLLSLWVARLSIGGLLWPVVLAGVLNASPRNPSAEQPVGIDEHLGQQADLETVFADEQGNPVRLADLVDRPTVLSFAYFHCPGICTPLLAGLTDVLGKVDLEPGKDFRVITVSINKDETPQEAREKKRNFMKGLRMVRAFPDEQWRWLTGDSLNIARLTESVGYGFLRRGDDFAHPAAVIVLTREGKIARYLYGTEFNHFDLKMALLEASRGRTGPSIAKVLRFCFSYDPKGRKYVFNLTKVVGAVILLSALTYVVFLSWYAKKKRSQV
ncbi:MAG: SCO family protein [Calditrichaeota bacterium]|nr:MAG: SCO family protein [Calditrichota bacterium]